MGEEEHGGGVDGIRKEHVVHRPIALEEDVWLDAIEEIVGRDFFPDVPRAVRPEGYVDVTGLSLDEFLHKYTSEDNASFRDILDRTNAKRREKVAHFMLPPGARPPVDDAQRQLEGGKKYEAINLLMYDGSTRSSLPLARIEEATRRGSSKSIQHRATSLVAAEGPVITGPQDDAGLSPGRQGYSLLEMPSFRPGEDVTPFMTWGDIDATPVRLNHDGTVAGNHGDDAPRRSEFRMRDTPLREQLALSLGNKASKSGGIFPTRSKQTPRSIPPTGSAKRTPSVHEMSPAAQRLAAGRIRTLAHKPARHRIFAKRPRSSWDDT